MSDFEINIQRFVERTKADADRVCRAIGLELASRIILRSPVGNPDLWKANRDAVLYNSEVGNFNFSLRLDPSNVDKRGRLKRGKKLKDGMNLVAGKGYVGGAFRRNWIVSVGSPSNRVVPGVDPSGAQAIADAAAALASFKAGPDIFIRNSLPYGPRLEMGYSTQAPMGFVRLTVVEFQDAVNKAVSSVRSGD